MVAGEVCCGFFHELKLHLQFPGFPFELAQPRAFADGQRRFLAGMLTAVYANTTDLSHAGSRDAVTWDFALVWRRRGTPGRRLGV
jgi:hypothetical protein